MLRRNFGPLACLLFFLAVGPTAQAGDGNLRISFEPGVCQGFIPCGQTRQIYVYAILEGATAGGLTGVEYSLQVGVDGNSDPGWTFHETFAPNTVALGTGGFSPPDQYAVTPRRNVGRGVNVAWAECQTGENGMLLVETVEVTNTGCSEAQLSLVVGSHDTPGNTFFRCPLATLCNGPIYSKVCLGENVESCANPDREHAQPTYCSTSGRAIINPTPGSGLRSPCLITAVAPATWGSVKDLYR
jgi:hypothetical protein